MGFARLHLLVARDEGQTMAEYAVVLTVITIALVLAFAALGGGIEATIDRARAVL